MQRYNNFSIIPKINEQNIDKMRKYLNSEQETWLYLNYRDNDNSDLAAELTIMVREENNKQIARLEGLLPEITDANTRRVMERNIKSLKKVDKITPEYVKNAAIRLGCPPKSLALISKSSRKKALIANINRWEKKAVVVTSPMEWFRSFLLNECRICKLSGKRELNKIRAAMSKWNKTEGFQKQYTLISEYIEEANLLRVRAIINRSK